MESKETQGSVFTVYIPIDLTSAPIKEKDDELYIPSTVEPTKTPNKSRNALTENNLPVVPKENYVHDDRNKVKVSDNCVLIIDDDKVFAEIAKKIVQKKGYK